MELAGYVATLLVGVSLGLLGGGGSILMVPILTYLFARPPIVATGYSLALVGVTSLVAASRFWRKGEVDLAGGLAFALPSLATVIATRRLIVANLPPEVLGVDKNVLVMVVFAGVMLTASLAMIRPRRNAAAPRSSRPRLAALGVGVGLVNGFVGAGGGFLIVPALALFGGFGIRAAIGTSLAVIALNSLGGFAADLLAGVPAELGFLGALAAIAIAGSFVGTALNQRVPTDRLRPAFGWFVLVMAVLILTRELLLR